MDISMTAAIDTWQAYSRNVATGAERVLANGLTMDQARAFAAAAARYGVVVTWDEETKDG